MTTDRRLAQEAKALVASGRPGGPAIRRRRAPDARRRRGRRPGSEGCGDDRRAAVHHLHGAMPLLGLLPPCTLRGVEYLPAGQVPEWRLRRAGERQRVDVVVLVGDVVLVAGLPTPLPVGRDATSLPLATGSRPVSGPFDHLDDLGTRSLATGKAGASPGIEMRRQTAKDGWFNWALWPRASSSCRDSWQMDSRRSRASHTTY
jgi:hypothetical protein